MNRWLVLAVASLLCAGDVQADNLRADQWQPLLYEPLSKSRVAHSGIDITAPLPGGGSYSMPDLDYGDREFDDGGDAGGLFYSTSHYTSLGPNVISVRLVSHSSQAFYQGPSEERPAGSVSSTSSITYSFRLMKDARVRVTARSTVGVEHGGTSDARIRLGGLGSDVVTFDGNGDIGEVYLTLSAGNYVLEASATSHNGGSPLFSNVKHAFATVNFEMRQWPDRSPVEVLDPLRSDWLTFNDISRRVTLSAVPQSRFWSGGVEASGVAADGVTPLLIRWRPDTRSEFTTIGMLPGQLISIDQFNDGPPYAAGDSIFDQVEVERVNLPGYQHANRYACAILIAPIDYPGTVDDGHDPVWTQPLVAQSWRDGVPIQQEWKDIPIYRPPVVLLHGLEDKGESWKWELMNDPRFDVHVEDYEASNDQPLLTNVLLHKVVFRSVVDARRKLWDQGIANSQVDLFGHSMGGLLARLWSQQDNLFLRGDNLYRGDFHKLITVCTPSRGSEFSYLAVNPDGSLTPFSRLAGPLIDWLKRRCTTCGAVRDMRPDSDVLYDMNTRAPLVSIPTHAIYGTGGLEVPPQSYYVDEKRFLVSMCPDPNFSAFFGGPNDAVVGVASQQHGLDGYHVSQLTGASGLHFPAINGPEENTHNEQANSAALLLLLADARSERFAENFPLYDQRPHPTAEISACAAQEPLDPPVVDIVTPQTASVFAPGAVIPVVVTTRHPATVQLLCAQATVVDGGAPNTFMVHTRESSVGILRMLAVATFVPPLTGTATAHVHVRLRPTTPPTALIANRQTISLDNFAPSRQLRVTGVYGDGVVRDITRDAETTYDILDAQVASADAAGYVTGRRVGTTLLTVRNGTANASVMVHVQSAQGDWNSDGQVDGTDAAIFAGAYTGPNSATGFAPPHAAHQFAFDFDGDNDIDCDDRRSLLALWTSLSPAPTFAPCPSCRADMNGDGSATVQDIFDFLDAWFAGEPDADINQVGGVTVQDIFDFLAAYFGGCA
ncbi:MAG: hypothetical protein IT438_00790 [Phycisphaerales bacterium]|nr:hypothetical protein [Phycisphaerales bacterium]